MKRTHSSQWRTKPSEKKVFVSRVIQHAFPILDNTKPKKKRILDAACGNGIGVTLPLLRRGNDVYCFDHVSSALNAVKSNAEKEGFKCFRSKARLKKADFYKKWPYKDGFFDSTVCMQAIYHGRLEQIMFALSEAKRVTKKGGYFFSSFVPYDMHFDKKKKNFYLKVKNPEGKVLKSYQRKDSSQPHLFYGMSKDWEYNVPHYYFEKEELLIILKQFFKNIRIKKVYHQYDPFCCFWYVSAQV